MLYPNFESLPFRRGYGVIIDEADREEYIQIAKRIDWKEVATQSTNSSYNLRKTLIEKQFLSHQSNRLGIGEAEYTWACRPYPRRWGLRPV